MQAAIKSFRRSLSTRSVPGWTRLSLFFAALLFLQACQQGNTDGAEQELALPEWQLVWSDEFDGAALDLSKWEVQLGDGIAYGVDGWGNGELQYYTADNITVTGGNLEIRSLAEDFNTPDPAFGNDPDYDWTSARIRTQGLFDFTFGRVEARIMMPASEGIWSAFWLLGSDNSQYGPNWAAKGEIDVVEAYSRGDPGFGIDPFVSSAAHFGGPFPFNTFLAKRFDESFLPAGAPPFQPYNDYVVYAIEWDEREIRFFVDGVNFMTIPARSYWNYFEDAVNGFEPGGEAAPFDGLFHIILNSAIGGSLPDSVGEVPSMTMDDVMYVDYVRVYQCSDPTDGGYFCRNIQEPEGENYVNQFRPLEWESQDVFSILEDLYVDGPGPERLLEIRDLDFLTVNGLVATEVTVDGDTYVDILAPAAAGASSVPGFSVIDALGDPFIVSGFKPGLGDFKFDIYVEGDSGNLNGNLRVSMVSPGARQGVIIPLNTLPVDQWERVTIPIDDILNSPGIGVVDVGDVTELIRFEFSDAHVRLDNIQFACGGQVCGIVDEIPVYIDGVEPLWDRGIVGDDTDQRFGLTNGGFPNPDYTDGTMFHVMWDEITLPGEPARGSVVESYFGTTGAVGAVNFIGSTDPVPAIAALTNGEFRFDIRVVSNPNDVELLFKVDAVGSSTGEQPLGDLPVGTAPGDWRTFTCPISTLAQQGLDTAAIAAPFVLVPGPRGAGQDVRVQWDNVTFNPLSTGSATPLAMPLIFDTLPGFCLPIQPFAGGAWAIVDNPGPDAVNGNGRVGQVRKFSTSGPDEVFGGVAIQLSTPVEFEGPDDNTGKAFTLKSYSPRVGLPITFKLESGPGVGPGRIYTTTVADAWEEFTIDFAGEGSGSFGTLTIILDNGVVGDGGDDFTAYIDQVVQSDSTSVAGDLSNPPNSYDFDQPNTLYPLTEFGESRAAVGTGPMGDPGNSGNVGQVTLNDFAQSVNGIVLGGTEGFPNAIPFSAGNQRISMRVWTPQAGTPVVMKVEDRDDAFQFDEDVQMTTVGGAWETLTFDFSDAFLTDTFEKVVIVFNPGFDHDGEVYYFDDLMVVP